MTRNQPPAGPSVFAVLVAGIEVPPAAWLAVLDDDERARADRFRRASDRLTFVAAHVLKRLALAAARPGSAAAALRFLTDPYGKPALAEGDAPHFNLSHTAGLAALALWPRAPVGIDVEAVDHTLATPDLARSVFTPAEVAALNRADDWTTAFLSLWTAKEAVIKAEGKGLSLPLAGIAVGPTDAVGPSGRWRLWRTRPAGRHFLTLAWAGEPETVRYHPLGMSELTEWVTNGRIPAASCPTPHRED